MQKGRGRRWAEAQRGRDAEGQRAQSYRRRGLTVAEPHHNKGAQGSGAKAQR